MSSKQSAVKFSARDVDLWIASVGASDATELAEMFCQKEVAELAAAFKKIDRAFRSIQKTFPDAVMYSANDGLSLLLGPDHDEVLGRPREDTAQQQRIVQIDAPHLGRISGGDW